MSSSLLLALAIAHTPAYGYGPSLVPLEAAGGRHRRVSHGGRVPGFAGTLAHSPDRDVTVVVLANRGGVFVGELAPDALRYAFSPATGAAARLVMRMAGMDWHGRRVR